ncbi:M48 family metalloprotease [Candidatus Woesearchaeota archaeon]|nr:M48 family metalloprotease [Candidatus Woesearchaeota archaeon]
MIGFNHVKYFMYDSSNIKIILASLFLSLIAFGFLRYNNKLTNNKKLMLTYLHIIGVIFPVIFFLYSAGCRAWFYGCSKTNAIIYIALLALISGGITVLLVTPYFFIKKYLRNSSEIKGNFISYFIEKYSKKLSIIKPKIYLVNIAKPIAFSFSRIKPGIFISVGMVDILSKKELYAVLLHELGHIFYRSPSLKFSTFLMRYASPFTSFTSVDVKGLNKEERKADMFAIKIQKTSKHINSAKNKINRFNNFKEVI